MNLIELAPTTDSKLCASTLARVVACVGEGCCPQCAARLAPPTRASRNNSPAARPTVHSEGDCLNCNTRFSLWTWGAAPTHWAALIGVNSDPGSSLRVINGNERRITMKLNSRPAAPGSGAA